MKSHIRGSFIATGNIPNACSGYWQEPLSLLFGMCRGAMEFNNRVFLYGDRMIRVNLNWIRDYILTMKGFRYTDPELASFPDLLLELQHPKVFFYEIIVPVEDIHSGRPQPEHGGLSISSPDCCYYREGERFGLCRLELEADIEYLMVEGVHMIWQATGDDDWMRRALPHMEKGLHYIMTDPLRWDGRYQLVKRPRTLDTWDFLDNPRSAYDRRIHPDDPMGIFHGDNTGLYNAKLLLAKMYRYCGMEQDAVRSEEEAAALRERIMKYLWNGRFFRHFLPLTPVDYGVDEGFQLSLSNAYALNRSILTLDERCSVIDAYRTMREKYHGELDDFRNLDPPYPMFMDRKAGEYVNGANAPFVAGQLALGAFEFGEERYGVDILKRMGRKMIRDGKIAFLYDWDGNDIGGGPRCWCGAELMHAEVAGLAGVVDRSRLFRDVTLSVRFAAADEPAAHVRIEYPASGALVEYHYRFDKKSNRIGFELWSHHDDVTLRMLLPEKADSPEFFLDGVSSSFELETVGGSRYLVRRHFPGGSQAEIRFT